MAQAAQKHPPSFRNRQRPRPHSKGVVINLKIDSRDAGEREVFAHAPISSSGKKQSPQPADRDEVGRQPTDFDEPAPLPEETPEEEASEKPDVKKHRAAAQPEARGEIPEEESYRPFAKTGEEEDEDEFGQQGSGDQNEGGGQQNGEQQSGQEQEKQQSDQGSDGQTAGDTQGQKAKGAANQSTDAEGPENAADHGGGQQERQSRRQKLAAQKKAEAEKKAASAAAEALEKKLNPQFMATKEFVLWCWRTVIVSCGLTLVAITAYYLSIFCFHPPGFCEPGEEFDIPGDKTWRNTIFTVGVTFLTIVAIGIAGLLLVLIIFLSMCATPMGFLQNWGPCLEAFRTVKGI